MGRIGTPKTAEAIKSGEKRHKKARGYCSFQKCTVFGKERLMEGHDFSRANAVQKTSALAAEGIALPLPSGIKIH